MTVGWTAIGLTTSPARAETGVDSTLVNSPLIGDFNAFSRRQSQFLTLLSHMKFSWLLVIVLLVLVAVFSVQNAEPIAVRFLTWEFVLSAALVIQLAALLGGLVGLAVGALSRRTPRPERRPSSPANPPAVRDETRGSV